MIIGKATKAYFISTILLSVSFSMLSAHSEEMFNKPIAILVLGVMTLFYALAVAAD